MVDISTMSVKVEILTIQGRKDKVETPTIWGRTKKVEISAIWGRKDMVEISTISVRQKNLPYNGRTYGIPQKVEISTICFNSVFQTVESFNFVFLAAIYQLLRLNYISCIGIDPTGARGQRPPLKMLGGKVKVSPLQYFFR